MPRIASLSPHELRGCTLRVTLTTLLRLRLESRWIRADSGRSCRVNEQTIYICDLGPRVSSAALFVFSDETAPNLGLLWSAGTNNNAYRNKTFTKKTLPADRAGISQYHRWKNSARPNFGRVRVGFRSLFRVLEQATPFNRERPRPELRSASPVIGAQSSLRSGILKSLANNHRDSPYGVALEDSQRIATFRVDRVPERT